MKDTISELIDAGYSDEEIVEQLTIESNVNQFSEGVVKLTKLSTGHWQIRVGTSKLDNISPENLSILKKFLNDSHKLEDK